MTQKLLLSLLLNYPEMILIFTVGTMHSVILLQAKHFIPSETVVHRMTGDGDKRLLIAPEWSADKKNVLNTLRRY